MKQNVKKGLSFLLISLVFMTSLIIPSFSAQAAGTLDLNAESAILVDAETGKVLYSKNADVALPPASMTKMMTEYLVLEAINNGDISWDTTTQISDYPYKVSANPSFSGIGLTQNKDYTVRDLYNAMAVFSDNGTTIALAELVSGSEAEFVKLMNQKAEEMSLPEAKFVNSTGIDNADLVGINPDLTDENGSNLLSAKSAALLAFHLINDYPEALDISKQTTVEFEGYTVENLNWMLPHDATNFKQYYYEGMDGLKTGHTILAGYTFTGTSERNGSRLISVVMKTASEDERFKETAKLMDYGYTQFQSTELFPKGYKLEGESAIPVAKGKEDTVEVSLNEGVTLPIDPDNADKYHIEYNIDKDKLNEDGELTAPIEKGEVVGTATVKFDGENDFGYIFPESESTIELVTDDAVEKSNWFMLTLGAIGDFFANLFTASVDWIKGLFS
ncbi:serine hydrolase [Oceanobacillus zhaokaii]|nr:serine hydrolase [Oceanobacillus zhaokaii]